MSIQDFYTIKGDKIILNQQGDFPEREIGTIKSTEEETIAYFKERYDRIKAKVDEVNKLIQENENKGSFLQKVINLREEIKEHDGIGDYTSLEDLLKNLQSMLEDYIQQNRKRNLEVKNTLIEEAKSYAANPNWKEATEQLKDLRQRWIKVGAVEQELKEDIEDKFQAVYDDFYERKKTFHDARMAMMKSRVDQYKALIEEAKKINAQKELAEEAKKEQLNKLVDSWKELENIPKSSYDELLEEFKKLTKTKQSKKGGAKKPSNNKEAEEKKKSLIDQLEKLIAEGGDQLVNKAKAIQSDWKNAGKVSLPKELNERFFYLIDHIFENDFLEQLFNKKVKDQSDEKQALRQKMNILRDLISRDKKELLIFEENMGKFTLSSSKADKMIGFKLDKQKRKLTVKQDILSDLQEKYKNL